MPDPTLNYEGETPTGEIAMAAPVDSREAKEHAQVDEKRRANVKNILAKVKAAKKHWEPDFKRMRNDVFFAEGNHWDGIPGLEDDRLVVDITTRHLQLRTAALYAKNPTVVARRRDQIEFLMWDETPESAVKAQAMVQTSQTPEGMAAAAEDPNFAVAVADAAALLEDIKEGMERRQALDKLARTLELVFKHQVEQMQPPFKGQVKSMIPRSLTTGVGYIKLDYQRQMQRKPGQENRLADDTDRLAQLQRRLREWKEDESEGDYDKTRAEYDELLLQVQSSQAEPVVLKEGLLFQFPKSWAIIPDKKCTSLTGFAGSDWVAEELEMTPEDIEDTWGVEVADKSYTHYLRQQDGQLVEWAGGGSDDNCQSVACVYQVYNRRSGLVYIVCDGYDDFLVEPAPPEVYFPHFFPWFAYVPNKAESGRSVFPRSDVNLMKPMQKELNRNAEALRQHRIANQPKYMHDATAFEDDEIVNIMEMPVHSSTPIKAIAEGKDPEKMIFRVPKQDIDPAVYGADVIYEMIMRVVGSQEANFGQPAKPGDRTTATGASIAEASRLSSQQSNADDLDDLLSLLALNGGVVLLTQMGKQQAMKIAGRGATWVQLTREEACEQLYLEIVAGSSGRPNQAQEVGIAEKVMPLLFQVPGMSPQKIAEWLIRVLDGRVRPSELMDPAITQSIVSMNRGASSLMGGDVANDPAQQGAAGSQNGANDNPSTEGQRAGVQPVAA